MSTASAPMEIGRVALNVRDHDRVAGFYASLLGLTRLAGDGSGSLWGAGDRPLLELRADPALRPAERRAAGLFHTAFLMPDRAALARWLVHAAESGVRLQGASDHLVSEAVYLADPEGNGIEVYVDRPRDRWHGADGKIAMDTLALDLNGLAKAADGPWTGAPDGLVVGHVHLQVGDVAGAEMFYRDRLGFAVMAHYPGASFMGAGGYHHHLGANVWNSRGAGLRTAGTTGLADLEIRATAAELARIGVAAGSVLADPWGTSVTLTLQ